MPVIIGFRSVPAEKTFQRKRQHIGPSKGFGSKVASTYPFVGPANPQAPEQATEVRGGRVITRDKRGEITTREHVTDEGIHRRRSATKLLGDAA